MLNQKGRSNVEIDNYEQRGIAFADPREIKDYSFPTPSTYSGEKFGSSDATFGKLRIKLEDALSNKILARLPADEIESLLPKVEPVRLGGRKNLNEPWAGNGNLYFLMSGIVSSHTVFKDGAVAEIGVIGNEGVVGLSAILNNSIPEYWAKAVVAGNALKVKADALKNEFWCGSRLQQLLLDYTGTYLNQVSQRSVCNSQHKIEERFVSWLLMMHDRMGSDSLPLTQEEIAGCLGTRRSSITVAAIALQQRSIIHYVRGQIQILDRGELESAACECYENINPDVQKRRLMSR